jgi:hypothetical protein
MDAIKAKMKAEMKADREKMMEAKMDGRQEEMKAQMASFTSWIEDSNEKVPSYHRWTYIKRRWWPQYTPFKW